jgi:3-oxoacyl-[acyl-carrier protein] reductase
VNAIAAGIFDTDLAQALPERWIKCTSFGLAVRQATGTRGVRAFMCSDRNSYMNGEVVIVDGGAVT